MRLSIRPVGANHGGYLCNCPAETSFNVINPRLGPFQLLQKHLGPHRGQFNEGTCPFGNPRGMLLSIR